MHLPHYPPTKTRARAFTRKRSSRICSGHAPARSLRPIDGTLFAAAKVGFLLVRLSPKTITLAFIGDRSETLYETTLATGA
nr:hypothetical protein RKHAN_03278 [Rhizobium sp. Khangiran2]